MKVCVRNLTDEESEVLSRLADAWNAYLKLPDLTADDFDEFRHSIHRAQEKVMCRPIGEARRRRPSSQPTREADE